MANKKESASEITYAGIPVSEGVIIGKVYRLDSGQKTINKYSLSEENIPGEITRFKNAMSNTRKEVVQIQEKIAKAMGKDHANIFNAHILLIEDFTLIDEVVTRIKKEKINADYIFSSVMARFTKVFNEMEDEYLRDRVADIKDVTRRVLKNLDDNQKNEFPMIQEEVIILAYDLSPSETALMHKEYVVGFATDIGGKTSHTAIMARSLGIPAVVGLHDVSSRIPTGTKIILDGNKGLLIVNPKQTTIKRYSDKKSIFDDYEHKLHELAKEPSKTLDGHSIDLLANIELLDDIESSLSNGAVGIGLYRTEYSYMNRTGLPSEDDLFELYSKIVKNMNGMPVVIRTIDIGGDKFLCHMQLPEEMNPFLGWRAIRFCLERIDIFKTQMRAILRASALGKTKIMFPMISNVTEVIQAKQVLKQCMDELKSEKINFDNKIEIGVMIEIPGAAMICDLLAKEVDFFSIGTNDLIQYSLAVDRVNEKIAYLYQPLHPAIIRLIKIVVEAGKKYNVEVDICGEMASDPSAAIILVGLGIDKFSLSPFCIPKIKNIIRSIKYSECKEIIQNIEHCSTDEEIKAIVTPFVKRIIPNFLV